MSRINTQIFKSPYGELILGSFNEKLCLCDWRYRINRDRIDSRIQRGLKADYIDQDDAVLVQVRAQLGEYFQHQRRQFDVPLLTVGTPFQNSVWNGLLNIPFGQTASYLQLAESIGKPQAIRAVASANGANTISILIPCHRIIGSNGQLTGYAGGLEAKTGLLALETDLFN